MAISLVQHTNKDAAAALSTTLAYGSNIAANHLLLVVVRWGGTGSTATITDTLGNTWNNLTSHVIASFAGLQISWAISNGAGADTITVTLGASGTIRVAIYEYSGTATVNPLDVENNSATGTSTTPAANSITPAGDGELIIGATCVNAGNPETFTAGANYTLEDQVPAPTVTKLGVEDWIQTTATATTAPFSLNTSDQWMSAIAAFKAAPTLITVIDPDVPSPPVWSPAGGLSLADDWLPLVPQPPLFEWDQDDRWQLNHDFRVSLSTGEEDIGLLPIIPNIVYDDDPSRSFEIRQQQEDEPWHTFFLIPILPPNLGWDDWDWSKDYSTTYLKPLEAEPFDFTLPVIPSFGWFDENVTLFSGNAGPLAGMVVLDEFTRVPITGISQIIWLQ